MKVIAAGLVGFVVGALAISAVQNLLRAGESSKNKHSLVEARNIVYLLERYRAETGQYPPLEEGLRQADPYLVSRFAKHVWLTDIYDRPYIVFTDAAGAAVVSTGRNGFVVRNGMIVPPADGSLDPAASRTRPAGLPSDAASMSNGGWVSCTQTTKEPYAAFDCQIFQETGELSASGHFAHARRQGEHFAPIGAPFVHINCESYDGVTIHLAGGAYLVPHGEVEYPFDSQNLRVVMYEMGQPLKSEVQKRMLRRPNSP
jgi:hypothetical protein